MNDLVERALEKAGQKLAAQEAAQREALALYFDLYTRASSPDGRLTEEYCYFDSEEEPMRYFRKDALPLSDEEMEQLLWMRAQLEATAPKQQAEQHNAPEPRKPVLGQVLYMIGCVALILTVGLWISQNFIVGLHLDFLADGLSTYLTWACIWTAFIGAGKALILLTGIDNRTRSQAE